MKSSLIVFCFCCLITLRISAAEEGKERLLLFSCAGAKLLFEIPTARAEGLPKWNPDNGKPAPLSATANTQHLAIR
jgi:hypothetical protein